MEECDLAVRRRKAGAWSAWYRTAIPRAEKLYAAYLKEREKEEGKP